MSITFTANGTTQYVGCSAGATGPAGTGDYTIVTLTRPFGNHGAVSLFSGSLTGTRVRDIITDSGVWFGIFDFVGFGTATNNTWYLAGQSKSAGSNLYHWSIWPYTSDGSGTKTHGDEASGTHGDGSAIAGIRIGDGEDRGNGDVALVAVWNRVLSDADFDSLCGNTAQAFMSLASGAPDALLLCNVASPGDVVDATGNGADATTVVGADVTIGADPPGFDYSISTSNGTSPFLWLKI